MTSSRSDWECQIAAKLFAGRTDAIGTEEGGSLPTDEQSWSMRVADHFNGQGPPVGVYPMIPTIDTDAGQVRWNVHWGCIDYDEGDEDSRVYAKNTVLVLDIAAGIKGFIEKSRSKGYHVWVFAVEAVPAIMMRKALLAAAQVVGAPMKEINPKQVVLGYDEDRDMLKLGNYVRLPYPGGILSEGRHRNVMNGDGWYTFEEFLAAADTSRCTAKQLDTMGSKYIAPVKKERRVPDPNINMDAPWKDRLDGLSYVMIFGHPTDPSKRGGPMPTQDRSGWLWKLCNSLIERSQLTVEEMVTALVLAHDSYCPDKFGERAEMEMERMLDKALGEHGEHEDG